MKRYLSVAPGILFALALIFFGIQKFGAENFIFERLAQNSGIGLFEPAVRILTGALEVLAGALILLPHLRIWGVLLGLGLVSGAIFFHLTPWLGINIPAAPGGEETPALFITALFIWVIGLCALFINRAQLKKIGILSFPK